MIGGLFTVIAFGSFIAIAIWAWSRQNRARFDEAARLPLEDENLPACCRKPPANEDGIAP